MDIPNSSVSKPRVVVLGSGPIRIGQGIEFDYASVHCVRALRDAGCEAIIINNNPETVSTDFDISDRLYFEPLTTEDVLHVLRREGWQENLTPRPPLLRKEGEQKEHSSPFPSEGRGWGGVVPFKGVITQFGGQTAINLARPLHDAGVPILGTSADAIDLAEDRLRFETVLQELSIPRPAGRAVRTTPDAVLAAKEVGYPVLVRPSYVLGGRAMEIVYNEDDLRRYMAHAVDISGGHPILVDRYLMGKEAETDAICDGQGGVLLPGIMEHIERAGVHSGDSMAVYPPQTLSPRTVEQMTDYAMRLAQRIGVVGLLNIQFVIDTDGEAFVIEANPRASRTVPYLSKITGVPMVKLATRACLGTSLGEQGYNNGLWPAGECIAVKAPVFSFAKLGGVDINLGPEMKSTGEVLGIDTDFSRALHKAMVGAGIRVPTGGNNRALLVTLADRDKDEALPIVQDFHALGFQIYATHGTAAFLNAHGLPATPVLKISEGTPNLLDLIKGGTVSLLINTISPDKRTESEAALIRRASVEHSLPCLTSLDTARALHTALSPREHGEAFQVRTVDTYTHV